MSNLEKVREAFDSLIEISINKELNVKLRGQIIKDAKESLPLLEEAIVERDRLKEALLSQIEIFEQCIKDKHNHSAIGTAKWLTRLNKKALESGE